jgi:hypothetical protein
MLRQYSRFSARRPRHSSLEAPYTSSPSTVAGLTPSATTCRIRFKAIIGWVSNTTVSAGGEDTESQRLEMHMGRQD